MPVGFNLIEEVARLFAVMERRMERSLAAKRAEEQLGI